MSVLLELARVAAPPPRTRPVESGGSFCSRAAFAPPAAGGGLGPLRHCALRQRDGRGIQHCRRGDIGSGAVQVGGQETERIPDLLYDPNNEGAPSSTLPSTLPPTTGNPSGRTSETVVTGGSQRRYAVPMLGAFAIADAEINVAMPPTSRRRESHAWDPRNVQRRRSKQNEKPGFKPVAGLGAMLGFLAAGPAGAVAGAAASVMTSGKDTLAGDTVRTAAKAAEKLGGVAWDATTKAANAANVADFVRRGIDEVDGFSRSTTQGKKD